MSTLRRSTPVFLPKMSKLGAYCTFLFKAWFKLWYNGWQDEICNSQSCLVIFKLSYILEKVTSCLINAGMGKNTSLLYVFWGTVSNISFYGQEKADPGAAYCTYMTLLRYLQLYTSKRHQRAPTLRSGITQIRHIQRHPLNTHMTSSVCLTLFENTFYLVFKCVSTLLGSFPGKSTTNEFTVRIISTLLSESLCVKCVFMLLFASTSLYLRRKISFFPLFCVHM